MRIFVLLMYAIRITIQCVGITFTHTSTFVLDIDNVDNVVF